MGLGVWPALTLVAVRRNCQMYCHCYYRYTATATCYCYYTAATTTTILLYYYYCDYYVFHWETYTERCDSQ